jgi:hypothetical protein
MFALLVSVDISSLATLISEVSNLKQLAIWFEIIIV